MSMSVKEERTQLRDKVLLTISTPFEIRQVPYANPPSEKVFDIKDYYNREWTMIFLDKKFYKRIEDLCKKRGLNPTKVLYGMLLKLVQILK